MARPQKSTRRKRGAEAVAPASPGSDPEPISKRGRKGKGRAVERVEVDDGEDEPVTTQDPASQVGSQFEEASFPMTQYTGHIEPDTVNAIKEKIGADQFNALVGNTVRYILFQDARKFPVKREDLNKKLLANFKQQGLSSAILHAAALELEEVFGYQLAEVITPILDDAAKLKKGASAGGVKKAGHYMLVNKMPELRTRLPVSNNDKKMRALVMLVLGIIEIEKGSCNENTLWQALEGVGIEKTKQHPDFGDVKRAIEVTFTKQLYLVRQRVVADNGSREYMYARGPRALVELPITGTIDFVYQVFDKTMDPVEKQRYIDFHKSTDDSKDEEDAADAEESD